MKRRWLAFTLAAALAVTGVPVSETHAEVSSATRQKIDEIRKQKQSVLEEKNQINENISKQQQIMENAKKKIEEIQKEADPIEERYQEKLKEKEEVDQKFKARIRVLYMQGETNYLAQLLSANSFNQFLKRFEVVRLIAERDYELVAERQKVLNDVLREKAKLDEKIKEQNKYIEQANKAYQSLIAQLNKTNSQLSKVEAMEDDYEDEIIKINLADWKAGKLHFPWTGPLGKPVNGPVTSTFGWRVHPIFHTKKLHEGMDFGGSLGTPIYAAADGVVVSSRPSYGYGWLITIYHGDYHGKPFFTRYAHSYPYQVKVKVGEEVKAGQQITSMGSNGNSTGPHLHFEVRIGYGDRPQPYNPMDYMK
ncbi:murein hydrolase activator EnvC [Thermoactinomyces sp. CICC 10522]|uniref:murein hydrolase activator EnvC family protein n=1 Tax=Thermoactinomyces sp. CICC 10522 TaxID=2767427 RepID=UPI0018DDE622|nr:peptidoglycan DD-metalloendopeptidase family protein [Thermoactinomyces sp. CICC 10522]MBH8605085.1 peptidoglycan DD-metalloendopeptidase family protein [Thermoactinomyces sp. CICC 10522]